MKCILLQLYGHWTVRRGGARLWACLPDREDKRSDALFLLRWLKIRLPHLLTFLLNLYCRTQTPPEKCPARVEEKQEERLLQSSRGGQECHWRGDQESVSETGTFTPPRCLHTQNVLLKPSLYSFHITSLFSVQTGTVVLVLRSRRKRRRSSRKLGKLSACFRMQRRGPGMTAVRIWRMTAWTWEVSNN